MSIQWRCQTTPELPGFAAYDIDIASSELPCGASWAGSVLLELGVPLWHPWGADSTAEWQMLADGSHRYQRADEGWTRLLPGLRHGREFRFRARPVPRLGHHWPGMYPTLPAILVVRDPRDALYSAWRRELARGALAADIDFLAFLSLPFRHWPISWAAYLALHTAAWCRQIAASGGWLLRFEDFKADPLALARRLAAALDIAVDEPALLRAVAASEHREVAQAEQRLLARGSVPTRLLAGGQVEEWRESFDAAKHAALPAWLWQVNAPLGYRALDPGTDAPPPSLRGLDACLPRSACDALAGASDLLATPVPPSLAALSRATARA